MSMFGKPVSELVTTLGTSAKFMKPFARGAVYGGAAGAAGSYASGDGHFMRDVALGSIGGMAASQAGRSYIKTAWRGGAEAYANKASLGGILGGGRDAFMARARGRVAGLERLAKRTPVG
jgi:hypothetical protein